MIMTDTDTERIMTADYLHAVADELFILTGDAPSVPSWQLMVEGLAAELAEIADQIEEQDDDQDGTEEQEFVALLAKQGARMLTDEEAQRLKVGIYAEDDEDDDRDAA